jgi:C-terminal processing protease CtpA/Prc
MEQSEISAVIDQVVPLLARHYVFPEVGTRIGTVLADGLASGRYPDGGDLATFAALVTVDLQSVNGDKHLRLRHHAVELPVDHGQDGAELIQLRRYSALHSGGMSRVERLAGNVGYLDVWPLLLPPSIGGDAVTAAMTILAGTDALIVDVRRCLGGDPEMVTFLCSYLFDVEPVHLNDLYDRGTDHTRQYWTLAHVPGRRFGAARPVWVLTSGTTFSGAEELAWDLQKRGRATIVGERTRGGAHPRQAFRVHPHLDVTISTGRSIDPVSGDNWEGVGVVPDVDVPAAQAFDTAYRAALDHVLTLGEAGERRETTSEARDAVAVLPAS